MYIGPPDRSSLVNNNFFGSSVYDSKEIRVNGNKEKLMYQKVLVKINAKQYFFKKYIK